MSYRTDFAGLRGLLLLVWAIAAMILAMKGATVISSERVRETLDALLSTPLTAKEILTQKIAGMKRLMIVLAIPILSVHLTLLLLNIDPRSLIFNFSFRLLFHVLWYTISCVLTTFLTMRIVAWISVLLGLRSTSQSRSAMTAICLIAGWVLLTTYTCRPRAVVFEVVRTTMESLSPPIPWQGSRYEESPDQLKLSTIASAVCCLIRLDGGVQANEAFLISAGNSNVEKIELNYAPSRSIASALTVSSLVLLWQVVHASVNPKPDAAIGSATAWPTGSAAGQSRVGSTTVRIADDDGIGSDRMMRRGQGGDYTTNIARTAATGPSLNQVGCVTRASGTHHFLTLSENAALRPALLTHPR